MASPRKAPRYTAAEQQSDALAADLTAAAAAPGDAAFSDEPTADALCPCCGELLAWHEQPCPAPGGPAEAAPASSGSGVIMRASAQTFAYDIGQPVQPETQDRAYAIIWRGQLKERHPETGWIHRVNVYRLNDGYWDCYREEELQVA